MMTNDAIQAEMLLNDFVARAYAEERAACERGRRARAARDKVQDAIMDREDRDWAEWQRQRHANLQQKGTEEI
jgi:hypothetical protein